MGYFGGLQKCARYYDGTAYRWGAWVNTGSAAAGADYAAEDGLCVVYRAQAYYTGYGRGERPSAAERGDELHKSTVHR